MGHAVPPSAAVARLLRTRREDLGLSLRDIEARAAALGDPISFTIIAKVERGIVDPGFRRLNALLRIYDIPVEVASELADLEQFAGALPPEPTVGYEEAIEQWKAGDLRKGLAYLLALKTQTTREPAARLSRQKALLAFAIAAGSLGRYRLSRNIVDDLLLEPPEPTLLVPTLTQAAACWHQLGSGEVALALLGRAETLVAPGDHQALAWVCHNRASTLVTLHLFTEAEKELCRALAAYRSAKDTYGEGRALGVLVRLEMERGAFDDALRTAREAQAHAQREGHQRLVVMRRIDEGRLLLELDERAAGITALNDALGRATMAQDDECQFHARYHLWKAYQAVKDVARADFELHAAQFHVRFLDENSPEAVEVRKTTGHTVAGKKGARRPGRRA